MLEQEMASIIHFVLKKAGTPFTYYWNMPQHISVPAAFFPIPEIDTGGETFLTYYMDYVWYIKLFHKTEQEAYTLGYSVIKAIKEARNLVPLISEDCSEVKGNWVRVNDPALKVLDDGVAQLAISWRSRKPYQDTVEGATQSKSFNVDVFMKSGRTISDAYAEALEKYAVPVQSSGKEPD